MKLAVKAVTDLIETWLAANHLCKLPAKHMEDAVGRVLDEYVGKGGMSLEEAVNRVLPALIEKPANRFEYSANQSKQWRDDMQASAYDGLEDLESALQQSAVVMEDLRTLHNETGPRYSKIIKLLLDWTLTLKKRCQKLQEENSTLKNTGKGKCA